MKTKIILLTLILLTAVLVAGCTQVPAKEQELPETTEPVDEPIDEVQVEPEPIMGTDCVVDTDCDDDDYCTTEACLSGECVNTLITGCISKKNLEPYLVAVNLGDDEWIELYSEQYRVDFWTIQNQNGTVFYEFPDTFTINNKLRIYTENGFATTTEWYLFEKDFWNEGDTVYLKNVDGEVISEMKG